MKRRLLILFSMLLVIMAVGCKGSKEDTSSEQVFDAKDIDDCEIIQLKDISGDDKETQGYFSTYYHNFAKAPKGYYYIDFLANLLMYFDEETEETYPVCSKINCNHNTMDCSARLATKEMAESDKYFGFGIYYYDGYIYAIKKSGELMQISSDGAERKTIAKIYDADAANGRIGENLVFHNGYVYAYNMNMNISKKEEHEETIVRYSLKTGESNTVVSYKTNVGSSITNVRCYGNQLFFTTTGISKNDDNKVVWNFKGIYVYNIETGELGKIVDGDVIDYIVNYNEKNIVYFVKDKGYYIYDCNSGESRFVKEATQDNQIVLLSYDGKYIYEDNGKWIPQTKRAGIDVKNRCIVYDTSLNYVRTVDLSNIAHGGYVYFGDENYMFCDGISQDNRNFLYVKKSGNWEAKMMNFDYSKVVEKGANSK